MLADFSILLTNDFKALDSSFDVLLSLDSEICFLKLFESMPLKIGVSLIGSAIALLIKVYHTLQ